MRRVLCLCLLLLLPASGIAQDDDRGYLQALLEDNLSGAGREVRITGFEGALSSHATIEELTIADDDGIWLTLRGVALDWTRSALLSGHLMVDSLTAREILLTRAPGTGKTAPKAEAGSFALPELPVSVSIGTVRADKLVLGAAILGTQTTVKLEGHAALADGAGDAALTIARTDGPVGRLALSGAYSNATRMLRLALDVTEGANGIAAGLIGLPGTPAIVLTIAGDGSIDDYTAKLGLQTDGAERLAGTFGLRTALEAGAPEGTLPTREFALDVAGDIAPLFLPQYRDFFGASIRIAATGNRNPANELTLSQLQIEAQNLSLSGHAKIRADGLPDAFSLAGSIGDGTSSILLPLPGAETRITSAQVNLSFDAASDDRWTARAEVQGLARPETVVDRLHLRGTGRIARGQGVDERSIDAVVVFGAEGIELADAGLARALGRDIDGSLNAAWKDGSPLHVSQLRLGGEGFDLTGDVQIAGLTLAGWGEAHIDDLSRLSGLAGRSLGGRGTLTAKGEVSPLDGSFDADVTVAGSGLQIGIPEVDNLLANESHLTLSARRDLQGTQLRAFALDAGTLSARASGWWRSIGSDLAGTVTLGDLSTLGPAYRGSLSAQARLEESNGVERITATALGEGLAIGNPDADKLLRGQTSFAISANRTDKRIRIEQLTLDNPQLTAHAAALAEGETRRIDLTARLTDLGLFTPDIPGPVTVAGRIEEQDAGYSVDLSAQGPGGIDGKVTGSVATDFGQANLIISGQAQAALANAFIAPFSIAGPLRFDLQLDGAPSLSSLSGSITLPSTRLSAPTLNVALRDATINAHLSGGIAQLDLRGTVESGGEVTVSGPVQLSAPYSADLTASLARVTLEDPELFTTRLDGTIAVAGPLAGGAAITGKINLIETELRVPSTGLGGAGTIPDLRHVNEPTAVHTTRARAGLLDTEGRKQGGGRAYGLDITVAAPNRVFIRGRGLDAELGGSLRLQGTTAEIIPAGAFDLVRGRLDILGKRFSLDEGHLQLQGEFIPTVRLGASTTVDQVVTTILVEGPATDPMIHFTSQPELPEEEVLALILFGRDLTTISPFQAAQLASAVASLAGRGGEGIVGRLRQGFGLDNLDIQTSEGGAAAVTAGKYLSRNLYSEVTVDSEGKSQINLNLDLTKSVTVKGRATSDGTTGVGIYLEKDY